MLRSFRVRLLIGSVLWTMGLLFIAHMLSLAIMMHFQDRDFFHIVFVQRGHRVEARDAQDAKVAAAAAVRETLAESRSRTYTRGGALSIVSMLAGLFLVWHGLRSLRELRARLSAVRAGRERRVEGTYPSEVQPLVNDLNGLLEHRERLVERAQAKAGDLAHGLKTPLALLAQEAEHAAAAGQTELAGSIHQQVERMRRQIDYHLAQARAAASGSSSGAATLLRDSIEGIARTLEKLHGDRGIDLRNDVPEGESVGVERQDLDEMFGNLLENAFRWARSRVRVISSQEQGFAVVDVDDDGPGIDPSMREAVLRRGVRADQAGPGWGLGLAIVRELAELYGGSISLGTSPDGGLRARLRLPARPPAAPAHGDPTRV